MAGGEVRVRWVVELITRNNGVVCPDFEHFFAGLTGSAVDVKLVLGEVHGSPFIQRGFEGGFDLPILDEILCQEFETAGFVVFGLCWGRMLLVSCD